MTCEGVQSSQPGKVGGSLDHLTEWLLVFVLGHVPFAICFFFFNTYFERCVFSLREMDKQSLVSVLFPLFVFLGWGTNLHLQFWPLMRLTPHYQVLTPNVPDIMVVPPEDDHLHHVIDTMALHVLDGGCAFEQAIMERGRGNPLFNFLFELGSKEHTYYVWRLYSFAQVYHVRLLPLNSLPLFLLMVSVILGCFSVDICLKCCAYHYNYNCLCCGKCRVIHYRGGEQNLS